MSISNIQSALYTGNQSAVTKKEKTDTAGKTAGTTPESEKATSAATSEAAGVVYEKTRTEEKDYKTENAALIKQMKADSQNRLSQLQSLVETMFKKQGITIGKADDMWKILAGGNFTADAGTIAQAKEDISEDGYWGVKQTSERIFSFAKALSGGNQEDMEKMRAAFEKGFKEATKTWGKELPSISQDTYAAVEKMFDDYAASFEKADTAETEA